MYVLYMYMQDNVDINGSASHKIPTTTGYYYDAQLLGPVHVGLLFM